MTKRSQHDDDGDRLIGRAHPTKKADGSERLRDEARDDGGPRYGGGPWSVADERGDQRFGKARNDDADPSEVARGEAELEDDESVSDELDTGEIESSGQREGMHRGEKPRKDSER